MAELSPRAKMLSVIPHVTGGLSIFGSSTIILSVSLHPRRRAESTYHRLMMCMSCCDIISSFAYFVSTWALPQGINEGWGDPYFFAAVGNEATCTAQGVAIQFGVVTALYNLALAVHYLLIVRWRISKQILRAKYDSFLRWTPPIVALGLTIPGIFLKAYANCNLW